MSLIGSLRRSRVVQVLAALAVVGASVVVPDAAQAGTSSVGIGSYENTSSSVKYVGTWKPTVASTDSGGSSHYATTAGSASLTFRGRGIQVISRLAPSGGIADVYIDGVRYGSVDRYAPESSFQQVVFERRALSDGVHTITVEWTGRANSRATSTNAVLDRFVVTDVSPPPRPARTAASMRESSAVIAWPAVSDAMLDGYRVYRMASSGAELIGQTGRSTTTFTAHGAPSSTRLGFAVTAVDRAGNESPYSPTATVSTGTTASDSYRHARCPDATTTVSDRKSLMAAVNSARPGDVIALAPGTYLGQITVSARGTSSKPIWVCAPRSAIIDGGDITANHGILIEDSSHLIVTGMEVTDSLKGVTVRRSAHVTVSDVFVHDIGYEAIHLRENTTDSTVVGNVIRSTGLVNPEYGEGIYIGSSENNWCALMACGPDRSDRNAIVSNQISAAGADLIEAKEGTTSGTIRGNILDGSAGMPRADAWVKIKGNDWSVISNQGDTSVRNGFRLQGTGSTWGLRAVFADNELKVDAPGWGFSLYEPAGQYSTRTIVSCDNKVLGAGSGFASHGCVP